MSQDISSISAGSGYGINYTVVGQESQNIANVQNRWTEQMKTLDEKVNLVKEYYKAKGSDAITAEVDAYWPTLVKMKETMGLYSDFLAKAGSLSMNEDDNLASSVKNTMVG